MSAELKNIQSVLIGLDAIRRQADYWVEFNLKQRAREGLDSTDDTHVMSPPWWPSHGQLKAWSKTLTESADALASKEAEILALADALHNAVHALVLNIGPDDDAAQAGIAVLARHDPRKPLQALQGDADV